MPSPKSHRRGQEEKNRKQRLSERPSSFHGRIPDLRREMLPRPGTVPNLLSGKVAVGVVSPTDVRPKLTKLLLNVTIQRSLGAVQVVMSPEATVRDLTAAALRQYVKEGRRPVLSSTEHSEFGLHYSQFSLDSLDRDEKLMALGSRNFFMCPKRTVTESNGGDDGASLKSSASCSKQADKASKIIGLPWLKFMGFLL